MGWPLLPWQQYVADVAGECEPDGTFFYDTIILTVQRQAGKTTLDLAAGIQNCLLGQRRRVWYTAQSGQHAGDKWRDMVDNYFTQSAALSPMGKPSYSNGAQALTLVGGSTLRPHPPTEDSLHSKQSDRNTIDELWAFSEDMYRALKGAIVPTQTTRRKLMGQRPQVWLMSTEGTAESEALNTLLAQARTGALPERTAFFDWGIPLDTVLPNEERPEEVEAFLDLCYRHHPGAGYLFERSDLITWLHQLGIDEFSRAYGNRRSGSVKRIIPAPDWNDAGTIDTAPPDAPMCFGAGSGKDGADACITVTFQLADGRTITEVVEWGAGQSWTVPRLQELTAKHGAPAAIDRGGASSKLYDDAKNAGIDLIEMTLSGYSAACQTVYAGVVHRAQDGSRLPPTWLHRPHEKLNDAADIAAKRSVSDGGWVWGRRASAGSISALEAATMSTYGVAHLPEKHGLQIF